MMQKKYQLKRLDGTGELVAQIEESRFTINYKNQLNAAQFEAVSAVEGPYLIIAGAGTGKTQTLVYRVARLIETGYDPSSILLLTFTRKAAKQMMNRASLLLDERCGKISGGTFHSFANLILRRYAKAISLDPQFTILDQGDSEDAINLIRNQSGLVTEKKRFPNKQTLNKIYSLAVNTEKKIEEIIAENYPHFLYEHEAINKIHQIFSNYKRKNNLLDYDDLLIFFREFLNSDSPAKHSFLNGINFIMIDEYQDTNKLQADIVLGLAQKKNNVMVVGDDAQSIYSFRGANFKNIMAFPKLFPGTKIIKIEENYRSTQSILDFANRVHQQAIEKYDKRLYTKRKSGVLPNIVAASNEKLQSRFVVEKILDLREEGKKLREIAVLFRSSFFSFDLELELTKANIPFVKFGGMKFVEAAHIKDALAFLRITINPKDFVSWFRVLLLHEGVGPKSAQKIIDLVAENKLSTEMNPERISGFKLSDSLFNLFSCLYKLRTSKLTPTEALEIVLNYYNPIFKIQYDDFHKRGKDLEIFMNISANYRSLDSLLADMAIEPPVYSVVDIGAEDKQDEYVTLSTIHSAKGLEWDSVFIIHCLDGFFPMSRNADSDKSLEEERRLMYVAVTRAKNNLFVTYPMNIYERESGRTLSKPSRFISSITPDLAEGWLLDE